MDPVPAGDDWTGRPEEVSEAGPVVSAAEVAEVFVGSRMDLMGSKRPPPVEDGFAEVELTFSIVELPEELLSGTPLLVEEAALEDPVSAGAVVEGKRTPVGSITIPVSLALLEVAREED